MVKGSSTRDVIVIGGSAGALEALQTLLHGVPADIPAALFVVLHVGRVSLLASILARSTTLPVVPAQRGATFERGKVYVGVPGMHLLLHHDHILLRRGPRENFTRPAIDPLFRSAAASLGSRVIGVVLSGSLSDGTAARDQALRRPGRRPAAGRRAGARHAHQRAASRRGRPRGPGRRNGRSSK